MTARQKILQFLYPLIIGIRKFTGLKNLENKKLYRGTVPFHSLSVQLNNGQSLKFETLRGKKFLLVNTASDCGFTNQYGELQQLYNLASEKLMVIGFPANDFKEQEKGSDVQIAQFCEKNFGVTFPLVKKSSVIKNAEQNPVFKWLSHKEQNGWNNQQPGWNFSKYLVDETGILTHYFDPSVSPVSIEVLNAVDPTFKNFKILSNK